LQSHVGVEGVEKIDDPLSQHSRCSAML